VGVTTVLAGSGIALAVTPLLTLRQPIPHITPDELLPVGDWPAPTLAVNTRSEGPVMVTSEYTAAAGQLDALADAVLDLRYMRRRTGASAWSAWSDAADPPRVVEQFVVASWEDHLRLHERVTRHDQSRIDLARSHTDPAHPTVVTHWVQLAPSDPPEPGAGPPAAASGEPSAIVAP